MKKDEKCVVPGCSKKADRRFRVDLLGDLTQPIFLGYVCEKHWLEVSRHDEPKKTMTIEQSLLG